MGRSESELFFFSFLLFFSEQLTYILAHPATHI